VKIVIINASPRKNGATAKVLNEFVSQINKESVDTALFHLSDLKMEFCKGCCSCYKTGHCVIDDDAEALSQTISKADGVIIGTPCYTSGVSGQLKTFIDRGHFVMEQLLRNKHTIGIVTYENAGGGSASKTMETLFTFSGAKTVDKFILKTPFGTDPIRNDKTKISIEKKATKFLNSIHGNQSSLKIRITQFFVMNFGIKPFVFKKGQSYQGVLHHWKNRGINMSI